VWQEETDIRQVAFDVTSHPGNIRGGPAGDSVALTFMDALGQVNARGISNVIVAYNPEVIVLDGPLARYYGEIVIGHAEPYIDRFLTLPRIVASSLDGKAPILGAAVSALEVAGAAP